MKKVSGWFWRRFMGNRRRYVLPGDLKVWRVDLEDFLAGEHCRDDVTVLPIGREVWVDDSSDPVLISSSMSYFGATLTEFRALEQSPTQKRPSRMIRLEETDD